MVWRPTLMESSDGLPLVTKLSDLFDFPYDRLTQDSILVQITLRPECVFLLLISYLVSKPLFVRLAKYIDTKASWFIVLLALHNLSLAIFSLVVAVNSWPILFDSFKRYGSYETYCDPKGLYWKDTGFGSWAVIFYLSKYWEFIDTWILVLKGKTPSFLQTFHHTGVVLCMWFGVVSQSSWLTSMVLLNSVIHTFMYTYYLIKTVSPTTQIKSIKYLTKAQILQFVVGIASYFPLMVSSNCDTESSRFGVFFTMIYLLCLIALFKAFSKKKYAAKELIPEKEVEIGYSDELSASDVEGQARTPKRRPSRSDIRK